MKKLIAMLLVVTMLISSAPTAVYAYDQTDSQRTITDKSGMQMDKTNSDNKDIWDGSVAEGFAGGKGTEEEPYLISNGAQLAYLASEINNGGGATYRGNHFVLTNDIYLNDVSEENWKEKNCNVWTPIGKNEDWRTGFQANFDGNGCTVYGVFIDNNDKYQGLFGCVAYDILTHTVIENLTIKDSYISGGDYVGGIIGNQCGKTEIVNCHSYAVVNGNEYIGGISGKDTSGRYLYCSNKGKITGNRFIGGITGYLFPGQGSGTTIAIDSCYNTGDIMGNNTIGGITGGISNWTASHAYINDCYNTGNMHVIENYVGGICGSLEPWQRVEYCYNVGTITCDNPEGSIGGIVGLRQVLTAVVNSFYLNTSVKVNDSASRTSAELMLQSTYSGFDFKNTWFFDSSEYKYPKLIMPTNHSRYYAKLIVVDAVTGQRITDFKFNVEANSDKTLNIIPNFDNNGYSVVIGEYECFSGGTKITISKDGYNDFTLSAEDLQKNYSLQLTDASFVYLTSKSGADTDLDIDYQTYILEHIDFIENRHNDLVKNKGFRNAYWTFDNGEEFALATIGNWLDNVNQIISVNFGDIKFEADYYDLFLSDLVVAMVDLENNSTLNFSAFEAYNKYYSQISDNWIAMLKYLDVNKEDLLSREERQAWDSLIENVKSSDGQVNWTLIEEDIERLFRGTPGKYEINEATEDLLDFIAGKEFLNNNRELFTEVFEGLDIANEVCEYVINAADSIEGFQTACQAYIAASLVDKLYDDFFTVLDETVVEMAKEDFNSAAKFQKVISKYHDSACDDGALFMSCTEELLKSTLAFTYDSFAKSYVTKIVQTDIAKLLGVPAGAVNAATLAYSIGYTISDYATGLSSKSENYTFMYYIAPFEAALESVSKKYAEKLLDERTYENAKAYDCTYRMLSSTNKYLYNCWYKIGASGLPIDIGDVHLGEIPEIMEFSVCFLNAWEVNKCHGVGKVISNRYKYTGIQCPVDVYVYDGNDNLIASIVDEEVKKSSEELTILVSDEKKAIVYPADMEYKITIVPRESGNMDYYVAEVDYDDIRNIDFYSIPIKKDVQYTGKIPAEFHAEASEYALLSRENQENADYDSNIKEKSLATPEKLSWENGTAKWNDIDNAEEYIVYLYKDGELLKIEYSKESTCNFDSQMKNPGAYTFCVIACGNQSLYENSRKSAHSDVLWVEKIETEEKNDNNGTQPMPSITKDRVSGANRFETAFKVADELKGELGIVKFNNIVVAYSDEYADALSATALAADKDAPILVVNKNNEVKVKNYIDKNLTKGGNVYIIGGTAVVSEKFEDSLAGYKVTRLGGADRFATNIAVLKALGVSGASDIMVASGLKYPDALSASATGEPVLLVGKTLTADQLAYIKTLGGNDDYYVIGGTSAVNATVMNQLKAAKVGDVTRLAGADRYETGLAVAEEFFGKAKTVVIASGNDFPDGLTGGVLANAMDAPLLLVNQYNTSEAANFVDDNNVKTVVAIGGTTAISNATLNKVA